MSQFQLLGFLFFVFLPWICRLETANCHVIKLDNLTSSSSSIPPTPLKTGTEEVLLYKISHRRKTAIFNIFNLTMLLLFVLHRKKKILKWNSSTPRSNTFSKKKSAKNVHTQATSCPPSPHHLGSSKFCQKHVNQLKASDVLIKTNYPWSTSQRPLFERAPSMEVSLFVLRDISSQLLKSIPRNTGCNLDSN